VQISSTGFWQGDDVPENHTTSDALANWIIDFLRFEKEKPIHDMGCGDGGILKRMHTAGFKHLTGYEGEPAVDRQFPNVLKQDLTRTFNVTEPGHVICLEVLEHIPTPYLTAVLDNIGRATDKGCKFVSSWAVRNQPGHGHVSCLDNNEAIEFVTKYGFQYRAMQTERAREAVREDPLWWFRNTLLIFEKI
jgi:hypothetical protein